MKVLFWGTPEFAVESLKAIINSKHEVVGVITQPDKPKGRGQKVQPTPVKEEALKYNIPVFQPEKIKNNPDIVEIIKNLNPDISVTLPTAFSSSVKVYEDTKRPFPSNIKSLSKSKVHLSIMKFSAIFTGKKYSCLKNILNGLLSV